MKICWDNLEKLRYSKRTGKWYNKNNDIFIYIEECNFCNNPFLSNSKINGLFCDKSCSKKKLYKGKNNPFYGRKHSIKTKELMSKKAIGKTNAKKKIGIIKNNIALYDTYAHQIEYAEQVRRNEDDENILEVKCTYCGKWYISKRNNIKSRIRVLNGKQSGESKLYCSNECKQECPIYNQKKYPKGFKISSSREVQPELRQLVFKRDNWICQKCGSNKSLHCHHIEGIRHEPIESADIDKCITYCKKCHKEVHKKEGCRSVDMQCKEK